MSSKNISIYPSNKSKNVSSLTINKNAGGYDPNLFLDEKFVQDNTCGICLQVFKNPIEVHCKCGSIYCASCWKNEEIRQCLKNNYTHINKLTQMTCPGHRGDENTKILLPFCHESFHKKNVISSAMMKCQFYELGCKSTFCMGTDERNIIQHKKICMFEPVSCELCKKEMLRCELEDHSTNLCEYRTFICAICNHPVIKKDELTHKIEDKLCKNTIFCPNDCQTVILNSELDEHFTTCPNYQITCNPCKILGIKVKIKRCELINHVKENMESHVVGLILMENKRAKKKKKELKEEEPKNTEPNTFILEKKSIYKKNKRKKFEPSKEENEEKKDNFINLLNEEDNELLTPLSTSPIASLQIGSLCKFKDKNKLWKLGIVHQIINNCKLIIKFEENNIYKFSDYIPVEDIVLT